MAGRAFALLISATVLAAGGLAPVAEGAPYQVRMCTPAAPRHDFQIVNQAPSRMTHTDSCASNGAITLSGRIGATGNNNDRITALANAPGGAVFTGWNAGFHDWIADDERIHARACRDPLCADGVAVYDGRANWGNPVTVNWRAGSSPALALEWFLACPADCGWEVEIPSIEMLRPLITLDDRRPPAPPASQLPPSPLRARQTVEYLAADDGGGVARVVPELDGVELPGAVLCTRVHDLLAGPVWDRLQPCPRVRAGRLTLDLRGERPGMHSLRLIAEDAAGQRTAGEPIPFRVGRGRYAVKIRAGFRRRMGSRRGRRVIRLVSRARVRHGRRVRVAGVLRTPEGRPLAGRQVRVYAKARFVSGGSFLAATAMSGARGRFAVGLRAERSLVLRVTHPDAATRSLTLAVPARSTLRVNRGAVPAGGSVVFRGRLLGGAVPRLGKLLEMQAFFRGSWRTFATTRTGRDGRWRVPYRFGPTSGPLSYRFRARVPFEYGYPFDTGTSRVTTVFVTAR